MHDIEAIRIIPNVESKQFRRDSNKIAPAISQAINFQLILPKIRHRRVATRI
jgi:hypothetical protein